jgi:hypothetical protein
MVAAITSRAPPAAAAAPGAPIVTATNTATFGAATYFITATLAAGLASLPALGSLILAAGGG